MVNQVIITSVYQLYACTGLLVYLRHPYPRCVSEPIDYEEALFTEGLEALGDNPDLISGYPGSFTVRLFNSYITLTWD